MQSYSTSKLRYWTGIQIFYKFVFHSFYGYRESEIHIKYEFSKQGYGSKNAALPAIIIIQIALHITRRQIFTK
jgi:hypothetical protein